MHIQISSFMATVYAGVAVILIGAMIFGAVTLRDTAQSNSLQIGDLVEQMAKLQKAVFDLRAVNSKYEFLLYRIGKLEEGIETNSGRIQKNRDAINRLRAADNATWYPPMRWPGNDQVTGLRLVLDGWFEGHA